MDVKVDYLSFSIPIHAISGELTDEMQDYVMAQLYGCGLADIWDDLAAQKWETGRARGFYEHFARCPAYGLEIQFGGYNRSIHVELPGVMCEYAREENLLDQLIAKNAGRISRLDIATDIETGVAPVEFVSKSDHARFRSLEEKTSETGQTVYVGSWKSDRFARVYRFRSPHPRSHLLRIEITLRRDAARLAASALVSDGLLAIAASVNEPFGWKHEAWQEPAMRQSVLPARRYDREGSGGVRWLLTTVLPALRKYQSTGLFDVHSWLTSEVLPTLEADMGVIEHKTP